MIPTKNNSSSEIDRLRQYDRGVMRSLFSSLFAVVIAYRRKSEKFTFQRLADATGRDKSEVSRWFATRPNWRIDTISDIASALDLDIEIRARERTSGRVFAPFGEVREIRAEEFNPSNKWPSTSPSRGALPYDNNPLSGGGLDFASRSQVMAA